jgi:putative DNA primase/helicase
MKLSVETYFKGLSNPTGPESLSYIIETIRTDESLRKKIEVIRAEKDKDKQDELKKRLPAVQFSAALADKGRALKTHSGLLQIDVDGIPPERAVELRDSWEYDPHIVGAFLSPRMGAKGIMRIPADPDSHKESWLAAEAYIQATYGEQIDNKTKDKARLCFLSHDPEAWFIEAGKTGLDVGKWGEEKPSQKIDAVSKESPIGDSQDTLVIYPDNDAGHAQRFCDRWKHEIAFIPERGEWLAFEGRWRKDINGGLTRRAITLAGEMMKQANESPCKSKDDLKRMAEAIASAARWGDTKLINSMLALAECFLEIQIPNTSVDAEHFLVGAENAVIDLRSGEGREYTRRDYITKTLGTHFDPEAECPRWLQFMEEIFPDEDVRRYVWKAIGYSITGDMREKCFFFLHGAGDNGKSVFLNLMEFILGNYADQGGKGLTVANSQGNYPLREAAKIVGKRLVLASETEEKEKMNTGVIKTITGGDSLDAAGVYEKHFTFKPACKIWFAGNYKPTIHDAGPAIWGRVRLIPFDRKFVDGEKDLGLEAKLKAEAPGILNWLIQGCLLWQAEGLVSPTRIVAEVESYRKDEDTLAEFIEDCTEPELLGKGIPHSILYPKYVSWAIDEGQKFTMTKKNLSKALRGRGWRDKREGKEKVLWQGVALKL